MAGKANSNPSGGEPIVPNVPVPNPVNAEKWLGQICDRDDAFLAAAVLGPEHVDLSTLTPPCVTSVREFLLLNFGALVYKCDPLSFFGVTVVEPEVPEPDPTPHANH